MYRVYREHRMGRVWEGTTDCTDLIRRAREGDCTDSTYHIYSDGGGYQVYRKHRVGDANLEDWMGALARISVSRRTDYHDDVKYTVEYEG